VLHCPSKYNTDAQIKASIYYTSQSLVRKLQISYSLGCWLPHNSTSEITVNRMRKRGGTLSQQGTTATKQKILCAKFNFSAEITAQSVYHI
jgi:hypothetical protein